MRTDGSPCVFLKIFIAFISSCHTAPEAVTGRRPNTLLSKSYMPLIHACKSGNNDYSFYRRISATISADSIEDENEHGGKRARMELDEFGASSADLCKMATAVNINTSASVKVIFSLNVPGSDSAQAK